jgi:DNA-binding GntR family transcriptional regulator
MELPLYRAIADRIETRIAAGLYAPGKPLPPEACFENEFNVSRITIRQALALLKRKGLLYSRSGAGTLVRTSTPGASMWMTGSLNDLAYYAAETHYRPIDRLLMRPSPAIVEMLGSTPSDHVFCFRGTRSRSKVGAFAFEEIYVPETLGRSLDNLKLGKRTLFTLLEKTNGFLITEVRQFITAVRAPAIVSRKLGLRPRSPMLRVTRQYKTAGNRAVEVAVTHFDVARFEYVMTLFRE